MSSQRSSERLYITMTFNGIIGQTKQVRKRFDELDIRGREPQLEFTVGCLASEALTIEESISKLREDAEIVNDINSVLLATSATLSDIAKEAIKTGITEQSHSLSARLSTFSNAWIRRDDGMEGLLHRLRGCGSALRMLWRLVDLFEQRSVQTRTLSKHKRAMMMEKPKSEMSRRFAGKQPLPPNYVASIWTDRPFVVNRMLVSWRKYGSEDDYRMALAALAGNDCNVRAMDDILTLFSSLGKVVYGDLLKALQRAGYNSIGVIKWLTRLVYLIRLIYPSEGSTRENEEIQCPLQNGLRANDYELDRICDEFEALREPVFEDETRLRRVLDNTSADAFTRFFPKMYL
ncbi:hypothetical protein FS842_002311 [Serendipita sp. 407]|nr:hypothetical protein FS842_002311 [Serendipita sp. 407]